MEENLQVNTEREITYITAAIGALDKEDFGSRTTIVMGESSIEKPVWATNDTIGIYPNTGDQLSFPIVNGVGTSTCTFDGGGWALKHSTAYTAYSPFNRTYYYADNDNLPVSMLGQKQTGNGSTAHMGKYDLQIAKGTTPESGKVKFQFEHQVCFLRMVLTAPIAATWKSITLESDALFTTEATMDLTLDSPTITPKSTSNTITLDLENVTTTPNDLSIVAYMMLLPVDLTGKSLYITLTDSEDNTYVADASITSENHNFGAAKARWITAEDFYLENIHVKEAGTLSSYVEEGINGIISLKLKGTLNNTDIITIRKMTSLKKLNLENVEFTHLDNENSYYDYTVDSYYNDVEYSIQVNNDGIYGINMFNTLASLESVVWSKYLSVMPSGTFSGCSNLKEIEFKGDLHTIGGGAFTNCAFESFEIPATVKDMTNPFSGCKSLINLTIAEGNNYFSVDEGVVLNKEKTKLLFVQPGFTGKYIIPNTITYINNSAFSGTSITSITFNSNLNYIPFSVCSGCKELTEVVIPNNVTTIQNNAFSGCSSLSFIDWPTSLQAIEDNAFRNCNFPSLTIPEGVISIGAYAFFGNNCNLSFISIPSTLQYIYTGAFMYSAADVIYWNCSLETFVQAVTEDEVRLDGPFYTPTGRGYSIVHIKNGTTISDWDSKIAALRYVASEVIADL